MWRWNGSLWTWISGPSEINQNGNYGELGIPSPTNRPGPRFGAVGWNDGDDLWLFGGDGIIEAPPGKLVL